MNDMGMGMMDHGRGSWPAWITASTAGMRDGHGSA